MFGYGWPRSGLSVGAACAQSSDPEFAGLSAWELTQGLRVQTACEVQEVYDGRCFFSEATKASFEKDIQGNLERAAAEYQKGLK